MLNAHNHCIPLRRNILQNHDSSIYDLDQFIYELMKIGNTDVHFTEESIKHAPSMETE